jgi:hypothetical protein
MMPPVEPQRVLQIELDVRWPYQFDRDVSLAQIGKKISVNDNAALRRLWRISFPV